MTYEEAQTKITSLLRFGSKPGLERIEKLLGLLGNPQDKLKFIHVAGTNGKGSTCALISSVLRKSGYRTGLFISPYVTDFCERMQINGEMISQDEVAELVEKIFPVVEQMEQNGDIITEFEFIMAIAMLWFVQNKCDIVVLEVGLGGRLDATNVIKTPLVSVITAISLDHTEILGETVEQIAREKCGIIKENGITVCYPEQPPQAYEIIRDTAAQRKNRFVRTHMNSVEVLSSNITGTGLDYRGLLVQLPFIGAHQIKNAVTALAVIEVLQGLGYRIADHSIEAGFCCASFPARLEVLSRSPLVVLDGAHNPEGIVALADAVQKYFGDKRIIAIMGMLADKDVTASINVLEGLFSKVITLAPKNPRAMSAEKLAALWWNRSTAAEPAKNIDAALQKALNSAGGDGAVLIFGSLYLAGEIRPHAIQLLQSR